MERLDFDELQGLDEVDHRAEHDRLQPAAGASGSRTRCTSAITEAGTKWSGSLKSAVGLGTLLADGIGDTIRISLSTFHAEEEVKVAWEILKALKLRERGPVLIACPTCGRLQFDMDTRRRRGRAAARGLRGPDRGLGARLRGQRDRRGPPRRLRDHRRQGHGDDLLAGRAAARRSRPSSSSTSCSPRSTATTRPASSVVRDEAERRRGARVAGRERGRDRDDARADGRDGGQAAAVSTRTARSPARPGVRLLHAAPGRGSTRRSRSARLAGGSAHRRAVPAGHHEAAGRCSSASSGSAR